MYILVVVSFINTKMKDKIHIDFLMEQQMCKTCKKTSSEYYELKLQIRFTYFNDLDTIKDSVKSTIYKNLDGINKEEELDNGFDFYFRSVGVKNKILKIFNKKYFVDETITKKIVGHNFLESKDVWRYTQLINIINLKNNDKVSVKGEDYYIKAFNKKDLVLRHLKTGAKKVVSYNISKDYISKIEE